MRFLIDLLIAVVIAATLGIGSAWYAVERGNLVAAVHVGPWTAWPAAGSPDADPYAVAWLARTGEVPLGNGEGVAFSADKDSAGGLLTGTCDYTVAGQTPAARLWTLTAYDASGRLMVNAARRTGIQSRELIRSPDGSFAIAVASEVRPGNWLPVSQVQHFKLTLRLYDTPITTGGQLASLSMPAIVRGRCG